MDFCCHTSKLHTGIITQLRQIQNRQKLYETLAVGLINLKATQKHGRPGRVDQQASLMPVYF
jgi:hypothetical protein